MSDTQVKFTSLQTVLLALVANRKDDDLSWGEVRDARTLAGDVPDNVLEPILTWLGVKHPLLPPEKHTRWASPSEYQREVKSDADEIIRDIRRDKVEEYLGKLDSDDIEKEVDWSEFDEDLDVRLHETADQAVAYTSRQYEILLWSHNESAADDYGIDSGDSATAVSAMAYYAYRQDLTDAVSISNAELAVRHGFVLGTDEAGDLVVVDLRA